MSKSIAMLPSFTTEHGQLFQGDCLDLMSQMESGSVDLIFADPPFNLGKMYGDHYDDATSEVEYLRWSKEWIERGCELLSPGGAFFLYNIPKWNIHNGKTFMELGMNFRHWITVDMKFGLPIQGKLYPAHYSMLYFTKGKPRTFTRPRLPIQVCRHCGGDVKDYGGHRNKLHPDGINVSDVWNDISPVRHKRTKNRGANELSEKMLERVLTIASNPGDTVFDPFGGSGTTYSVAERMHREWIGVELGDVEPIINRLDGTGNDVALPDLGDGGRKRAKSLKPRPLDESAPVLSLW
ncbi:site-specific DNA-methyltransferase [Cryobacterium sp. TMS1-13-1]|uniref:DNA-methyltransferase n=1 Tax=Cryobacterium sp. TMS1-13-1 TaxID=1259220 RepID=UPI001069A561|nr:site-specific DNA-methyltransferase [Cryobacterium sp. TMS1-13-1]TFD19111.1 site-specific DNA-methyltransferase [Cryobacterium sp. TMS1-13-1]